MRLYPGMIIQSNYSDRKHKIVSVLRNCTCPRYLDTLQHLSTGTVPPDSPEHIHLTCVDQRYGGESYFGGYVETDEGIRSIWSIGDELKIVSIPKNIQLELF